MQHVQTMLRFIWRGFGRWYAFATTRTSNGATCAVWLASLVIMCIVFSCVSAAVRSTGEAVGMIPTRTATAVPTVPPTPTQTSVPTVTPIPTETAIPTATSVPPTATPVPPTATPAPPVGVVTGEGNLRDAPGTRGTTVRGTLCRADAVEFIGRQEVDTVTWYHVRLTARGQTCGNAAALQSEGWASATFFTVPSASVAGYMDAIGMAVPTPIVYATDVPTHVPVVAAPRPAAPSSGGSGGGSTSSGSGVRVGATCRDGSHSNATGRGACSHHGGVAVWLYR